MWDDEIYFDDDEAAMEAYKAMVVGTGNGSDDDNDDDFQPDREIRRDVPPKSRRDLPPKSAKVSSNTRAPIISRSSSPAPLHSAAVTRAIAIDDEDMVIDIENDDVVVVSAAMPTPDISNLNVSLTAKDTSARSSDSLNAIQALREREQSIRLRMQQLERDIADLEKKCGVEAGADGKGKAAEVDMSEFKAPEWSVPIRANVMNFDWGKLGQACQFDVILMDPPWQLASQAPTRGVAIAYQQLPDVCIESLPIQLLQTSGFIFIWVINNKYTRAFQLMKQWGYTYVDDIAWVKQTHAKETCLIGKKGADPPNLQRSVASDVIFSERRGQSQKPEELYEIIEQLIPNGKYLEIFGRKNNLRDYWVTVGNEL
ncbi:MT-A70-domain-containing protein [Kickxella alabastrina]|uniref:MT-A70-domain-containing protein n=1 Tax=Kickxella alabastrina TaxID=61397 RepID=UPI00221E3BE7|nr:MT-A70-domain-containing protein [Kickxella alabastrina]KAI7833814.1 MT-A70-domain-containing protein [Kickxella alabastrina]